MVLHRCKKRFRVMACGRRFGKTLAATNEESKNAMEVPHSLNWWVAPTYRQAEIAFQLMADALQPVLKTKPNHSRLRMELINDSIVECRSAERYENMRGDGPNFVVIDEASKVPRAAWYEVIRPALTDTKGGAIIISTPWGRDWFWECYMLGQSADHPDWWSHSFPTLANPFIDPKEVEEMELTLSRRVFEQEFLAVFHEDAATVFRNVDACAIGEYKEPDPLHSYVIGWDVAKYADFSVLACLDAETHEMVAFDRFNGIEYRAQLPRVAYMAEMYNNAHVVMDATGVGDPVMEEAKAYGLDVEGYVFSTPSKKELIDRLVVAIEKEQIHYPAIPELLNELKAFSYQITPSRNIIYSAPEGMHDDTVMALALACYGARQGLSVPMAFSSLKREGVLPPKITDLKEDESWLLTRQDNMARNLRFLQGRDTWVIRQ